MSLEAGKLYWKAPPGGEQGYTAIDAARFAFDAPVGERTVSAWILSHNGYLVPNHETNAVDRLTKVVTVRVDDAGLNSLAIA